MRGRILSKLVLCALTAAWAALPAHATSSTFSPEQVWASRCGTCHTVGGGDDVGPDLAGVTERRDRAWLIDFIRSPTAVIEAGDEIAGELFERFGRQKMPDHPYSPEQIDALLTWIEAGGPGDPEPAVRPATTATARERRLGGELFRGERPRVAGGAPCAHCHTRARRGTGIRESLGGDLGDVYERYRDVELSHLLEGMASPLMAEIYGPRPLTEEEAFCIKAYLASAGAAVDEKSPNPAEGDAPWWLAAASLAVVLLGGDGLRLLRWYGASEPARSSDRDPSDLRDSGPRGER